MKLPDFSTFKPLNENREQMNADLPENLSFVTIDERLTEADLERKKAQAATQSPMPVKASPKTTAAPKPAKTASITHIHNHVPLLKLVVMVQTLLLVNMGLAAALLSYFGTPWEQPQTIACATPVTAEKQPTPFLRRDEYRDKNGVRHTITEQLPAKQ